MQLILSLTSSFSLSLEVQIGFCVAPLFQETGGHHHQRVVLVQRGLLMILHSRVWRRLLPFAGPRDLLQFHPNWNQVRVKVPPPVGVTVPFDPHE